MRTTDADNPEITVVGGGVIGITAALCLELGGYDTRLYTAHVPFEDKQQPSVSTPYAAASIQPVSVTMEDLGNVFATSQEFFGILSEAGTMGVRRQPHFVLYEEDRPDPEYRDVVDEFHRVADLDEYPHRPDAPEVSGWRFNAYFAEMPVFIERCYSLYRSLGGVIQKRELTRAEFLKLPGDVLLNCAGLGAWELCDDPRPCEIQVGHQVIVREHQLIRNSNNQLFSYKYTPDPEAIDSDLAGEVYAYPRMDALVLGGSRIPFDFDSDTEWDGEIEGATYTIDGVSVPARIVDTNTELLTEYTEVDLQTTDVTARYGYRPVRDPGGEGVRLERERIDDRPVIHNYGHGGAGVTLSWGSAIKSFSLVREMIEPDPDSLEVSGEFAVARHLASLIRRI